MIETREHLIHVLTEAAEIEHDLLCSYLYAAFSLKRPGEPGLTEAQGEAVERWRKTILRVAKEEMAHLACVNNLLVAVGGAPHFDRPNLPAAPGYHPAGIVVRLTPFNADTLEHFIFLERAASQRLEDAGGFEPVDAERIATPGALTPSAQDYDTIGELYDAIADGFARLAERLGEARLIDAEGAAQVHSGMMALENVPRITDLATALQVIEHIKEEGEGAEEGFVDSHFRRFCGIREEWAELSQAQPDFEPAWPAAADPVMRKPLAGLERVWIQVEPAAGCLDLANALYAVQLQLLAQAFAPGDEAQRATLVHASVEVMEASAGVATALARLPVGPGHPGVNAGITFAVPRNLGFRPAHNAEALIIERLRELKAGAQAQLTGEPAEKVDRRLQNALDKLSGATAG